MARRNEWLALKEKMIENGFTVEVKGKSKNEYICTKGNIIIVDLIYNRGAYLDMYVFDNMYNITHYKRYNYIDTYKIVNISNGEYEYLKEWED